MPADYVGALPDQCSKTFLSRVVSLLSKLQISSLFGNGRTEILFLCSYNTVLLKWLLPILNFKEHKFQRPQLTAQNWDDVQINVSLPHYGVIRLFFISVY
jgi:hypothetical protein